MSSAAIKPTLRGWPRALDAMWYWEPRRVIFNVVLVIVVVAWVALSWPHFRPALRLAGLLRLGALVLLANVCYSAAYVVEFSAQRSPWRGAWQANRWLLWLTGMLLSVLLANYWIADEVYPYVA